VPTHRSACARGRGTRTGALITQIPSERKTSSNSRVELAVAGADQEPWPDPFVVELHQQVARLLGHPRAVRVCRDTGDADAPRRQIDEEQDIEALQKQRVDGEEVALEDAPSLPAKELSPSSAPSVSVPARSPPPSRSPRRCSQRA
jgi:hypothetical protein